MARLILMGRIAAAHGLKGLVKLQSFTGEPAAIGRYGPLLDATGQRRFEVTVQNLVKGGVVARIAGSCGPDRGGEAPGHRALSAARGFAAGGRGRVLPRRSGRPRGRAERRDAPSGWCGRWRISAPATCWPSTGRERARSACPSPTGSCRWWIWRPAGSWSIRRWGCWRMVRQTRLAEAAEAAAEKEQA